MPQVPFYKLVFVSCFSVTSDRSIDWRMEVKFDCGSFLQRLCCGSALTSDPLLLSSHCFALLVRMIRSQGPLLSPSAHSRSPLSDREAVKLLHLPEGWRRRWKGVIIVHARKERTRTNESFTKCFPHFGKNVTFLVVLYYLYDCKCQ